MTKKKFSISHLNLMFRSWICHHTDLKLGHMLELLVRLNPLLETVNFLLKLRMSVRGCYGLNIDRHDF